jgi:3-methylfumaryl-CoA hydratase
LPQLWHWLYFLEAAPREQLGEDGHPRKGGFYPPVENPRRMFAGGRSETHRALRLGQPAQLTETILSCENKSGRSGEITLVTVGFEYHQAGELCISEQRNFIYLPARDGGPDAPYEGTEQAVPAAAWSRDMATDSTLLFRFSALTFNGHRIHYDQAYASAVEGYPALVVHGPMTAILLADLARANATHKPRHFRFRALAPLFCGDQLRLRGSPEEGVEGCQLIAYGPDGQVAMNAEVLA